MRLCIIGNSHIAAIRHGLTLTDDLRGVTPTLFGSHASTLRELHAEGRALVANSESVRHWLRATSNGLDHIDIDAYDAFVIFACGLGLATSGVIYDTHRLLAHAGEDAPHLVSCAVVEEVVSERARKSLALRVAGHIRALTDAPVFLAPEPLPAQSIRLSRPWWADDEARAYILNLWRKNLDDIRAQWNVIAQHEDTIADETFTKDEFSQGSLKMFEPGRDVAHRAGEPFHMNAAFGKLALERMRDAVVGVRA